MGQAPAVFSLPFMVFILRIIYGYINIDVNDHRPINKLFATFTNMR